MMRVLRAIGLMSGTSLDGVDVAMIDTDGESIGEFGPSRTFPYSDEDRRILRCALAAATELRDREQRPGVLAVAEELVTRRHAEAIETFCRENGIRKDCVDVVGFHGQTVLHDPARRLTVQIGNGDALAQRSAIPVIWDFRAADVAAGGQGAPLAPVFHRALCRTADLSPPVAFLNVGGVANVTVIAPDGELTAFDTGPGNALLDDWTQARTGKPFDENGTLAAAGSPSHGLLRQLLAQPYFAVPPPKSLDRNAFSLSALADLSDADGAATLLTFTAMSITASLQHVSPPPNAWFVCGGGRRNPALMRALRHMLDPVPVRPLEDLGFDGDATEAQAFAFLAVRVLNGQPLSYPLTTGVPAPTTGGRKSRPAHMVN